MVLKQDCERSLFMQKIVTCHFRLSLYIYIILNLACVKDNSGAILKGNDFWYLILKMKTATRNSMVERIAIIKNHDEIKEMFGLFSHINTESYHYREFNEIKDSD